MTAVLLCTDLLTPNSIYISICCVNLQQPPDTGSTKDRRSFTFTTPTFCNSLFLYYNFPNQFALIPQSESFLPLASPIVTTFWLGNCASPSFSHLAFTVYFFLTEVSPDGLLQVKTSECADKLVVYYILSKLVSNALLTNWSQTLRNNGAEHEIYLKQ